LDVLERRREDSIILLDKIKEIKCYVCTSILSACELIDIEQEFIHWTNMFAKRYTPDEILRKRKSKLLSLEQREDAIEKVKVFFRQYPIETYELDKNGWNIALEILRDLNVTAIDAIHIATAKETECIFFVSNDEELGKEARKIIRWQTPSQTLQMLRNSKSL
jgi:predicted nucleic acid-binding protein